jgi:hypothetical protein
MEHVHGNRLLVLANLRELKEYLLGAKEGTDGGDCEGLHERVDANIGEVGRLWRDCWLIGIVDEYFYKAK